MCPACLASLAVLLSGGVFSAFLVVKSRPDGNAPDSQPQPNGEENESSEDRLAG